MNTLYKGDKDNNNNNNNHTPIVVEVAMLKIAEECENAQITLSSFFLLHPGIALKSAHVIRVLLTQNLGHRQDVL